MTDRENPGTPEDAPAPGGSPETPPPADPAGSGAAPATPAAEIVPGPEAGTARPPADDDTLPSPAAPSTAPVPAEAAPSTEPVAAETAPSTEPVTAETPPATEATPPDSAPGTEAPADIPAEDPAATAPAATPTDAPADATAATPVDAPADGGTATDAPPPAAVEAPGETAPAPEAASGALHAERLQLVSESGGAITVGVQTVLGKHMVRQFGEDANVWDAEQCVVERAPDGGWQVVPREGTTNETLVNGEVLTAPRPLREGDVIAVGRAEKGISRLPLTVRPA